MPGNTIWIDVPVILNVRLRLEDKIMDSSQSIGNFPGSLRISQPQSQEVSLGFIVVLERVSAMHQAKVIDEAHITRL